MDIQNLTAELPFANHSGFTLNIQERTNLLLSVNKMNEYEKFDNVYFWGRINGKNP